MNVKRIAYKLQTALCQKGIYVKINQVQSYSNRAERMVTKYLLIKQEEVNGRNKNVTILETYQIADVVKKLSEMYGGG